MDSVGIGELPDAAAYGDQGSNTIGNIATRVPLKVPTLRALGLGRVASIGAADAAPQNGTIRPAAVGRMAEASAGKDSVTGHWEMMGIVLDRAFPTFPDGFPSDVIAGCSAADRPRRPWQQSGVGNDDHRRARRRAHADRLAHRLHVSRQRVPDRRPRRDRACIRALSCVRDRLQYRRRRARRRPRDRAPLRRSSRVVHAHDESARLCAAASPARLFSTSRRQHRCRWLQSGRSKILCRARDHEARFTPRATMRG